MEKLIEKLRSAVMTGSGQNRYIREDDLENIIREHAETMGDAAARKVDDEGTCLASPAINPLRGDDWGGGRYRAPKDQQREARDNAILEVMARAWCKEYDMGEEAWVQEFENMKPLLNVIRPYLRTKQEPVMADQKTLRLLLQNEFEALAPNDDEPAWTGSDFAIEAVRFLWPWISSEQRGIENVD